MTEPLRVLHITSVLRAAGIESFIMNMYRAVDRQKVQFDFLVMRDEKEFWDDTIERLGGRKYGAQIPSASSALDRVKKESAYLECFLKTHHYDIVHIHATTPLKAPYLKAAKKAGVPVRIYHSHSAYVSGKSKLKYVMYRVFQRMIARYATHYFACSQAAADWMYPKKLVQSGKVEVIPNGIDVDKFRYSVEKRRECRAELDIPRDAFVIGHTGRFTAQKNQKFVIDVFSELVQVMPNAELILLGAGDLLEDVTTYAQSSGSPDKIHFLGVRPDVDRVLSAMDAYVMPSLYEGLPVAAVEAECSGLPCYLSSNITREVAFTEQVQFLDLGDGAANWARAIAQHMAKYERSAGAVAVARHGYDISRAAQRLQQFYLSVA